MPVHDVPQFSIHRGRLQSVIRVRWSSGWAPGRFTPVVACRASRRTRWRHRAFLRSRRNEVETARGDILIGADGIHSKVRSTLFSRTRAIRAGTASRCGAARCDWPAFLDRRSMIIAGGMAAKLVLYPIAEGETPGNRLTNWVVYPTGEGGTLPPPKEDWSKPGKREDVLPFGAFHGAACRYPALIRRRRLLGLSDVRSRSAAALDPWPRHAARRRCPSDVSGRLQRRLAGDPRCALPGRLAGHAEHPRQALRPMSASACR
jgi:2-polyprenyl-6-methoxyphenol hydroxylase-like FAD-dependent oxidoreductase